MDLAKENNIQRWLEKAKSADKKASVCMNVKTNKLIGNGSNF